MSPGDPKTVLLRMLEAFATGDTADAADYVADGYHDHQGLRRREMYGVEGFAEVVSTARRAFVTLGLGVEDLIVSGDRAVGRIRWRGELDIGEIVDRETIDIVRVVDGRAVEHWGAQSWSRPTAAST